MAPKSFTLSRPIELHGKQHTTLTFKEPTGRQYLQFGDVQITGNLKGSRYFINNDEAINNYMSGCVEGEHGATLLELLNLTDAMKAKETILSFFSDAVQATSEKPSPPLS